MIPPYTKAVLTTDMPDAGLQKGDVGVVVHQYQQPLGYEIEFIALDGTTVAVVSVSANQKSFLPSDTFLFPKKHIEIHFPKIPKHSFHNHH